MQTILTRQEKFKKKKKIKMYDVWKLIGFMDKINNKNNEWQEWWTTEKMNNKYNQTMDRWADRMTNRQTDG